MSHVSAALQAPATRSQGKPYPFMLVAIDDQESGRGAAKDRLASTTAAGIKKVFQALQVPANVYSMTLRVQEGVQGADVFLEHREAGNQGPRLLCGAHYPHHQGAMLRRIAAGAADGGSGTYAG